METVERGTKKALTRREQARLDEELEMRAEGRRGELTAEVSDLGEQKSGLIAAQAAQTEAMLVN